MSIALQQASLRLALLDIVEVILTRQADQLLMPERGGAELA